MEEAGLPQGVFNIVHGIGEEAGAALVAHPDVPVISFTGETTTGQDHHAVGGRAPQGPVDGARRQVARASSSPTPTSPAALDSALFGVFSLNGERCTAGSRVLVERSLYDEFVDRARRSGPRRSASAIPATRPPSSAR